MVAAEKRVLVVDDEQIVRDSCKRVLTDAGYEVCAVSTGRDALSACRRERFDVMVTDLRMPDMDGLEITQAMTSEFPEIRVIVITGYPNSKSAETAKRLGIFDYLCKPVSAGRLTEATAAVLAHPPRYTSATFPTVAPESKPAPATAEATGVSPDLTDQAVLAPEPTAPALATEAPPETSEAHAAVPEEADISTLKAVGLLAVAPIAGLAFVVFLPLLGFGMLFAVIGSRLGLRLGRPQA